MTDTATPTRPATGSIEERTAQDVPAPTVDGRRLRGLIPYSVESRDMGGWREVIDPGALAGADLSELIATREHDRSRLLGRHPTTLTTEDRSDGFSWAVELPESPAGEDVRVAVQRGDLRSTSWRMIVGRDRWEGDVRHVEQIAALRDVTVTAAPAYGDAATAEYRSTEGDTSAIADNETTPIGATDAADQRQEDQAMQTTTEDRQQEQQGENTGGLQVEDRTAATTPEPTIEERVLDGLRNVRKGESRSLTTSSASSIAPPELSSFLFDKLRASSVALQSGISVIPTDRESVEWPKLATDVNPGWYAEAEVITAGDPTFVTLTATPKKLAHRVELSNEVIDDSEPKILDVLNGHLALILGLKLDHAIYHGSGIGDEPEGIANVDGIQTGGSPEDYDAFIEAIGMLQDANVPGPYVAAGPPSVFTDLALLKQETGSNQQLGAPAQMPQVYVSTQLEDVFVYAPSQVVLVRRQDANIELDRSRLFHQDMSELRGKLRADVLLPNPQAVVQLPITGS